MQATFENARRRRWSGVVAGALAIASVTAVIELLQLVAPALSLVSLYLFAVLPIAIGWGARYAIGVAVGSMLAFNFFFLPPLYTFTLRDRRNWIALLVFIVTAMVVSELATRSRRRAIESQLLAGIATSLLERGDVSGELERISAEVARALPVDQGQIVLGPGPVKPAPPGAETLPLSVGTRRVGAITVSEPSRDARAAARRILPGLSSLLGVAIDRERLAAEAVEAETLRASDAMKTALLRTVSHDLRSPLMAILTASSALERQDLELASDDRRELLETIRSEATRLDRLVDNLLDLSRLQAGAARPAQELWSVDDLVVQALGEVGEPGSRVEVAFADESPTVRVDGHQVERVLANLIENALKYSPSEQPVRVQVSTTASEVLIRVIDRGRGVSAEELERIFQPFQRGSGTADLRGAGLGLAIARGFAEANGGRVWAESREGQGAAFVLGLPIAPGLEVPV